MSYVVLARKYRPQMFDDIIGQGHITSTLRNAISQSRVAHAYLFAGPRGVGKTTTARILAKALNCEKALTPEPCGKCESCAEIGRGLSLDILEIDGASNRGIDEIRNLRENAKFAPSKGRFRIYIIDEVHMLTQEAFNALLKTLEEPPPHVKFIFATTQAHKVPPTILSRCQRFDFRRISSADIFTNLKRIAQTENISITDEALRLIARHSDGALRDAQVLLDQIASFIDGEVGPEEITKMLGLVGDDAIFEISHAIAAKDAASALRIVNQVMSDGKDAVQIVHSLIEFYRNIALVKVSSDLRPLIDAGDEKIKMYGSETQKFTIEEVLYIIYTLSNTIDFIRKSNIAKIPLEAAMIKLANRASIVSLDEMTRRVEEIKIEPANAKTDEGTIVNARPDGSPEITEIRNAWRNVINHIKPKKISAASYLNEGVPLKIENSVLYVVFPKELKLHKEALESVENKALIGEALKLVLGVEIRTAFLLSDSVPASSDSSGPSDEEISNPDPGAGTLQNNPDPILKTALDVFGGNITNSGNSAKAHAK